MHKDAVLYLECMAREGSGLKANNIALVGESLLILSRVCVAP